VEENYSSNKQEGSLVLSGPIGAATSTELPLPGSSKITRRAIQTVAVLTRHFAPLLARRTRVRPAEFASALRAAFEALGASYIKLGQLFASSPSLFGEDLAAACRALLDAGSPVPIAEVRSAVECELGRPLAEVFAEFEPEPIGRASLAVVHRGTTHDGRKVAVKILRPGIEATVAADVVLMKPVLEFIIAFVGSEIAGPLTQFVHAFKEQVTEELDLRREAQTMLRHRALLAHSDTPLLVIPEPYLDLSSRRILVMEFLDGFPVDDLSRVFALGIDPRPVVEQAVRAWFSTTIRHGVFHGDVHAGNLLLLCDGRLGVVDWGIEGRLDLDTHRFFLHVLQACLGCETEWDDVSKWLAQSVGPGLTRTVGIGAHEFPEFFRTHIEPVLTQPFGQATLAALVAGLQTFGQQADATYRRSLWGGISRWLKARIIGKGEYDAQPENGFDRSLLLLGKQLVYFERYGKLFLPDASLLEDRAFFTGLLPSTQRRTAALGSADGVVQS